MTRNEPAISQPAVNQQGGCQRQDRTKGRERFEQPGEDRRSLSGVPELDRDWLVTLSVSSGCQSHQNTQRKLTNKGLIQGETVGEVQLVPQTGGVYGSHLR